MRDRTRLCVIASLIWMHGCAVTGYTLVAPGTVGVGSLELDASSSWNQAPAGLSPNTRKDGRVWTKDGLLLDRLLIIPGVPDGEAIMTSRQKDALLPVFRASMLPNEIEELVESSIVKLFGEGAASVSTANLRPHRYGEHRGVLFDLDVAVSNGPTYKGLAGSFIVDDRLYLMLYFGAEPYYFDKHRAEAEAIITGDRLGRASGS